MKGNQPTKKAKDARRTNEALKSNASLPPIDEWEFSTCPPQQQEQCYQYEFLRECLDVAFLVFRKTFAARRIRERLGAASAARSLRRWRRDHRLQDVVLRLSTLKGLAENFPQIPFLRIPLQTRERQAAALELDLNYSPVANIAKHHPNMTARGTDLVVNENLLNKVEYFDGGICFGVYPVRLNWSLEKGAFQRLLIEWAESKRPDNVTSLGHRRTSPMDHLNSLEAFRLAKTGLSYDDIRSSAAEALKNVPGNVILQYTSPVSLNNAKNKAFEHMREIFMSERPPFDDRRYKRRASSKAKPKL